MKFFFIGSGDKIKSDWFNLEFLSLKDLYKFLVPNGPELDWSNPRKCPIRPLVKRDRFLNPNAIKWGEEVFWAFVADSGANTYDSLVDSFWREAPKSTPVPSDYLGRWTWLLEAEPIDAAIELADGRVERFGVDRGIQIVWLGFRNWWRNPELPLGELGSPPAMRPRRFPFNAGPYPRFGRNRGLLFRWRWIIGPIEVRRHSPAPPWDEDVAPLACDNGHTYSRWSEYKFCPQDGKPLN